MFTDTHCHLLKEYYDNLEVILENAKEVGIKKLINNGCNLSSNLEVLKISEKYPWIYCAIGYHPDSLFESQKIDFKFIENNIDKIIAIGEIGLDYHYDTFDKMAQIELFETQLKIASKYNKPVIVHSRDATSDTINILKKYPNVKGSIHCFSGSLETARIYIKMGYKLGIGGVITFKNAKIKDIIKEIPSSAILLETDSPYLAPTPLRGSKNEPANIKIIAKFIADILNISLEELSKITENNAKSLFDI